VQQWVTSFSAIRQTVTVTNKRPYNVESNLWCSVLLLEEHQLWCSVR